MNSAAQKTSNILVGVYVPADFNETMLSECAYSLAMQHNNVDVIFIHGGIPEDKSKTLFDIANSPKVTIISQQKDEEGKDVRKTEEHVSEKELSYSIHQIKMENFADFFNYGFNIAKTNGYKAFSFVDGEDVVSLKYYGIAETYMNENEKVGVFIPLVKPVVGGAFQGFMNEAVWGEGVAEEAGRFDHKLLLKSNCISIFGAVFMIDSLTATASEDFVQKEGDIWLPMKKTMNVASVYEFFLRLTYNDVKIINIPRIGYEMRVLRKENYDRCGVKLPANFREIPEDKGGYSQEEIMFWMKSATDNYFFEKDDTSMKFVSKPQIETVNG